MKILTDACHPLATVMAFTQIYEGRQWAGLRLNHSYAYQSNISLGFYYMGEMELTLSHINLVWKELTEFSRNSGLFVHYHSLLAILYQQLKAKELQAEEILTIETFLKNHPGHEASAYTIEYRRLENIELLIKEGKYTEAEACLNLELSANTPRYRQVASRYPLWQLAKLQGHEEQMHIHEAFIEQYGRNFFFYERIKREQQRSRSTTG